MKTQRLQMAVLGPEHAERTYPDMADERLYTFIPQRPPASLDALRGFYERLAAGASDPSERWLNWLMLRLDDEQPIGWLQATVYPGEHRAEVAWVVFAHAWRCGYGTEGVRWLFQHLRSAHGVQHLQADIDTRNVASIALADRLGFVWKRTVATDEGFDHIYTRSLTA